MLNDTSTPGDQFQGGGSKDDLDITQWLWKEGEPLDKDDITNAFAAGYVIPEDGGTTHNLPGDTIVYFGLDRLANNGSAQVGFWFLKDEVSKTDTPSGGGFTFDGQHEFGDILVQSNFSQGGTIDSVTVYEWDPTADHNLRLLSDATDCDSAGTDDPACAVVNKETEPKPPWPYTPKFPADPPADPSDYPQGSFFEGGINITRLLVRGPGTPTNPCISTFMAETRTSTQFDARLKDFALGGFALCGKHCPSSRAQ